MFPSSQSSRTIAQNGVLTKPSDPFQQQQQQQQQIEQVPHLNNRNSLDQQGQVQVQVQQLQQQQDQYSYSHFCHSPQDFSEQGCNNSHIQNSTNSNCNLFSNLNSQQQQALVQHHQEQQQQVNSNQAQNLTQTQNQGLTQTQAQAQNQPQGPYPTQDPYQGQTLTMQGMPPGPNSHNNPQALIPRRSGGMGGVPSFNSFDKNMPQSTSGSSSNNAIDALMGDISRRRMAMAQQAIAAIQQQNAALGLSEYDSSSGVSNMSHLTSLAAGNNMTNPYSMSHLNGGSHSGGNMLGRNYARRGSEFGQYSGVSSATADSFSSDMAAAAAAVFSPSGSHAHSHSHAPSSSQQWWVCRNCNQRAFVSRAEVLEHEATCGLRKDSNEKNSASHVTGGSSDLTAALQSNSNPMNVSQSMPTNLNSFSMGGFSSSQPGPASSRNQHMIHWEELQQMHRAANAQKAAAMLSANASGSDLTSLSTQRSIHTPSVNVNVNGHGLNTLLTNTMTNDPSVMARRNAQDIAMAAEEAKSNLYSSLSRPIPLAMPSDKDWITPLHCFVRRHCVEIFTASPEDVATPSKGKRRPIHVGQVGIRCPHCHKKEHPNPMGGKSGSVRERGSVYYPTTISSIYNATMNLLQRHLHSCDCIPADIMQRYGELKADDARSGTSKKYWIDSAKSLGLVDTILGIRVSTLDPPPLPSLSRQQITPGMRNVVRRNSNNFYSENSNAEVHADESNGVDTIQKREDGDDAEKVSSTNSNNPNSSQDTSGNDNDFNSKQEHSDSSKLDAGTNTQGHSKDSSLLEAPPLVIPEDKPNATAFSYALLSQMQPCVFTEADRLGKRKGLPPGFAGLACRHCYGGYGSGRFFPSSIKTMSDTSKTLNVLHSHMMRCRKCPHTVRKQLESLRKGHDEERAKMKFGSQKAFFAKIWLRLHGEKPPRGNTKRARSSVTMSKAADKMKEDPTRALKPAALVGFPSIVAAAGGISTPQLPPNLVVAEGGSPGDSTFGSIKRMRAA